MPDTPVTLARKLYDLNSKDAARAADFIIRTDGTLRGVLTQLDELVIAVGFIPGEKVRAVRAKIAGVLGKEIV